MVSRKRHSPKEIVTLAEAGAAAARRRKITRTAIFNTGRPEAIKYGPVEITMALPDPRRIDMELRAALPEVKAKLIKEFSLIDAGGDSDIIATRLSGLNHAASEMTIRAVYATYVTNLRDPKVSGKDESLIRLGWLAGLGVILNHYTASMAEEVVPFDPALVILLQSNSPDFSFFLSTELRRPMEYFKMNSEAELKNSRRSRPGTPPVVSTAAGAKKQSSSSHGGGTHSSTSLKEKKRKNSLKKI